MNLLETIGALTLAAVALFVLAIIYAIAAEARRALRQWCRICRVVCGRRWKEKARKDWRRFLKGWWREFGESYSSKEIRGIILPYDPSKPICRRTYA